MGAVDVPVSEEGDEAWYGFDPRSALGSVEVGYRTIPIVDGPGERDELHAEDHLRPCNLDLGGGRLRKVTVDVTVVLEVVSVDPRASKSACSRSRGWRLREKTTPALRSTMNRPVRPPVTIPSLDSIPVISNVNPEEKNNKRHALDGEVTHSDRKHLPRHRLALLVRYPPLDNHPREERAPEELEEA
jgi:hypothetical protein